MHTKLVLCCNQCCIHSIFIIQSTVKHKKYTFIYWFKLLMFSEILYIKNLLCLVQFCYTFMIFIFCVPSYTCAVDIIFSYKSVLSILIFYILHYVLIFNSAWFKPWVNDLSIIHAKIFLQTKIKRTQRVQSHNYLI